MVSWRHLLSWLCIYVDTVTWVTTLRFYYFNGFYSIQCVSAFANMCVRVRAWVREMEKKRETKLQDAFTKSTCSRWAQQPDRPSNLFPKWLITGIRNHNLKKATIKTTSESRSSISIRTRITSVSHRPDSCVMRGHPHGPTQWAALLVPMGSSYSRTKWHETLLCYNLWVYDTVKHPPSHGSAGNAACWGKIECARLL